MPSAKTESGAAVEPGAPILPAEAARPGSTAGPRSGRRFSPRTAALLRGLGGVAIALGIWEVVSASGMITSQALASVGATAGAISSHAGALTSAVGGTVEAWAVGVVIASAAGILLGALIGRSQIAEAFTEVLVRMMRPLPSLALIPIAILVAGLGLKMTAGLVAFTSFWPVFINTRYAVHQVDNLLIDTARTLDMRGIGLLVRVIVPAAAPLIASGIQVAISLALVVTVSVELVGGTGGIGSFVLSAQQANDVPTMYAGIIVGGTLGWALNVGFAVLARRALPWRDRREVAA